jgi:hypothetical protein
MPFCVSDTGVVLFLLGLEKYTPGWRGSLRWSAFEGGAKGTEDAIQTAVREFVEESIGVLTDDSGFVDMELRNQAYAVRLAIRTQSGGGSEHVTFVKQFPYRADLQDSFLKVRKHLLTLERIGRELEIAAEVLPGQHPYYRGGELIVVDGVQMIVHAVESIAHCGNGHIRISLRLREHADMCARMARTIVWMESGSVCESYVRWHELRLAATREVEANAYSPAGAVCVERDPLGLVTTVRVNSDFLEKSNVRLWSIDELRAAVANRAQLDESFRPYFTIVLERVLGEFSRPDASRHSRFG